MDSNTCKALVDSIEQLKNEEILLLKEEKQKLTALALGKIEELKNLGVPLPQIIKVAQVFAHREYELNKEIADKKQQLEILSTQEQLISSPLTGNLTIVSQNPVAKCEEILNALTRRR